MKIAGNIPFGRFENRMNSRHAGIGREFWIWYLKGNINKAYGIPYTEIISIGKYNSDFDQNNEQ